MLVPPAHAARAAYLASALHAAAAVVMLVVLRPGLPGPALAERLAYAAEHRFLWWGSWAVWHLAALSLLGFYVALAARVARGGPLQAIVAVLAATAGLSADLLAEGVYLYGAVSPRVPPELFPAVDDLTGIATGYAGNGLYTVAGLLLVWAGWRELPLPLRLLSLPVWLGGAVLAYASLVRSVPLQVGASAVLFPAFVAFTAATGRWLGRGPG